MAKKEDFDDGLGSSWNMAKAFMRRLDELMRQCHFMRQSDNFISYYEGLEGMYLELYPRMNKDEKKQIQSQKEKAEDFISTMQMHTGIRRTDPRTPKVLFNLEIQLRKVMNRDGMLVPEQDDPFN